MTPAQVAVFDLDGTITRGDTLTAFVLGVLRRRPGRVFRLWRLPAHLMSFVFSRDRGRLKARLLHAVLADLPRAEAEREAEAFLAQLMSAQLRPGAISTVAAHRAAGHRLVLLSASPDLYVRPLGARLGFDEVICTELEWQDGRFAGEFKTANRHGPEKLRCIAALRKHHPQARLTAYGNALSDVEHLAAVDEPHLVNAGARARRRAATLGIPTADWP